MSGIRLLILLLVMTLAWSQAEQSRAQSLFEQQDFAGAAAALQTHLEKAPDDRDSRILLGMCLNQLGRNAEAEQVFRETIRRKADDGQAQYYLALTEYLQGKLLEAEADAQYSITLGANASRSLHLIGRSREEQNRLQQALNAYLEAIAKDSVNAEARVRRRTGLPEDEPRG